ncbi:MAG: hypothetical protein PSX81_05940 [bacterium]|nr:hypothetical protein [bacterium]
MHTKVLIRTDSFIEHYQHWLNKDMEEVLEIMSGSYANEVFGKGADDFSFEQQAELIKISWKPTVLNRQSIGFLIDYFQTKLCENGYVLTLSDERQEVFDSGMRLTIHRHYLKPIKQNNSNSGLPYLNFGNLVIEHQFNQNRNQLCLTVTHNEVTNSGSFEKLMELLLG